MAGYDEQRKAMDAKMSHSSEFRFKVTNRRNRLLGEWAAAQLGHEGDEAAKYAESVVMSDFEEPGDDDVVRKVLADFEGGGVAVDEAGIRQQMADLLPEAQQQVQDAV